MTPLFSRMQPPICLKNEVKVMLHDNPAKLMWLE